MMKAVIFQNTNYGFSFGLTSRNSHWVIKLNAIWTRNRISPISNVQNTSSPSFSSDFITADLMHRFNCRSLIKCFAAERSRCLWSICEANGVQWEIAIKDGTLPCWEKTEIRLLIASINLKLFSPSSNLNDRVWWDPEIFVQNLVTAAWSWDLFPDFFKILILEMTMLYL